MNRSNPVLLWLAVLLPAMLGSYSIALRHRVEMANKAVGLAVEADSIQALASSQAIDFPFALANLKAQGLRAMAVGEETLGEIIAREQIEVLPGRTLGAAVQLKDVGLKISDPVMAERVLKYLEARFPRPSLEIGRRSIGIPATLAEARSASMGLDPIAAKMATDQGIVLIARLGNPVGVRPEYIKFHLKEAKNHGARFFLPSGDQVLGRRDLLPLLDDTLMELKMHYAAPEFAKIGGDANVVARNPGNVVRLHAAQAAEIDKLSYLSVIERYAKAARERNARLLLIRPTTNAAERPLTEFAGLVKDINDAVIKEGGAIGVPRPFEDSKVPRWLFLALGLACIPAVALMALQVLPRPWAGAAVALFGVLALLCWTESGRTYAALAYSILFPCYAYWILDRLRPTLPIVGYLLVSLISLVGGLCVAGLLNGLPFFVKADEFAGIKLATFLPILVVGGYFFHRLVGLPSVLKSPITWGASALAIGLIAVIAFMLSRTGNDNPAGVSGFELALRNLLDDALFVRPRTKEFLIGHPALFLGVAMLAQYRGERPPGASYGGWTALALMLGAIGSTSIVNTLCHLHTPVAISLARILLGITLGCILGSVVALLARKAIKGPGEVQGAEG